MSSLVNTADFTEVQPFTMHPAADNRHKAQAGIVHSCAPWRILLLLAVTVGLVASASAQDFRASITGEVTDPSGAVIPHVAVIVFNVATHVQYSATTNGQGIYSILYVLPGMYTVTAKAGNFQTMVYHDVRLDSAQQFGLNITLQPGSVAQQVVVTAGAVDLDTVSATSGGVVDHTKVANMPSTGMMVWDDVSFAEGVKSASANVFNLTPRNNANLYAVSGAQTDENVFYMNGAPISDQGSWYFTPNMSSVQQMQTSAMPYDAEYGRTGGGVFSTNLKSGADAYHGSIYDYYGNRVLNATPWIDKLSGIPKPVDTRNTWGGEVGGPIRKDKTFFFFSYEGFHQEQPATPTDTVPTAAERSGNFTGTGYTIYDPLSTYCAQKNASGGCTLYARKSFPNDTIPAGEISPIGAAILAMYPQQNQPGLTKNYVITWPTNYEYEQFIGRIDQNFSENTRLYGIYTHEHDHAQNAGNGLTNEAWSGSTPVSSNYNIVLDLTHILSPTKVLDLKASYGHTSALTTTGNAVQSGFSASKLGFNMPAVGTTSHQNIAPSMTVTGGTNIFGNTASGTADADADFSGSITQLVGRHSLHYGFEFMDIQTAPTGVLGNPNGAFTFDQTYTQGNPLQATTGQGNVFADVLLGYPSSGSVSWNEPTFVTMHYYALYMQDNFKALPNLSLNLGLRWDLNTSPRDRHDRINAGFCFTCANPLSAQINYAKAPGLQNPLVGGLQFAGVNGQSSAPYQNHWNDWQPRVGFSWAALRDTVIRGGYGIYFPWAPLGVDNTGFSQTTPFVASLNGKLTPDTNLNSGTPYPGGAIAPSGAAAGLATNAGNGITFNDLNGKLRMTQHWSFGIQRRMPAGILFDVEYLGSSVHGISISTPLGVVSTALQQQCNTDLSVCNTNVANPFYGVLSSSTSLGASSTIPAWELMRAYPLFNGVTENRVPSGSSHYHGVDVRAERTVRNLDFVFNYYYSNWMDRLTYLNSGDFVDANPTKTLDPLDRRNYISLNMVYPLPSTGKHGFVGVLANDWVFASTVIWGTGNPLQLPSANFNAGTSGCSSYAPQGGQTRAHWFNNNESCWANLGPWQPRTTPLYVGFIRNPSYMVWNPALSKQFALPFREMTAQFRMESTNGANHPIWGAPNISPATPASFSPTTSWTGFGTLPNTPLPQERQIIASLRISF
ncbi:TonB-dependent receptor [Edaphobacter acidisoli]|nr:TonB-dependent receptor [Edaphobacter acidisoli]